MIPLDDLERITAKMRERNATEILTKNEKEEWEQVPLPFGCPPTLAS